MALIQPKRKNRARAKYDYAEIYRQLRTNIEFAAVDKDLKVINVTSSSPQEAKSTVSMNLAGVYASKYGKTLLMDCDLRKPTAHKNFKLTNKLGLSNLIKDLRNVSGPLLDSMYIQQAKSPLTGELVYVLTSGSKVYNPAEVLASERFKLLMSKLREEFDVIIVDTPPALAVADTVYVSHLCDGTLFLVSSKETDRNHAKQAVTQLKRNGVNILGAVMTKVEKHSTGAYGYYYSYKD
ncbi:MAG: CpsD/CapB family tyrosine-protein kinase [Erysipelotrichaceae bacterium]